MKNKIFTQEKMLRLLFLGIATILYYAVFALLEKRQVPIHIIHTKLDDMIPFCRFFIIPYYMWFVYIVCTIVYFGVIRDNNTEFKDLFHSILVGIVVFLVVCMIFPNGQHMRPKIAGNDIFSQMVLSLYRTDTPTNILPSLHVYNSVACCAAIIRSSAFKKVRWIKIFAVILSVLIIASTMLLKQHSVIDVVSALFLNLVVYKVIYARKTAVLKKYEEVKSY